MWLWEPGPGRATGGDILDFSQGPWERGMGQKLGTPAGVGVELNPILPPGPSVHTWFPPLLGFTNTSRGFMRGDGVGLMTKGLQRPSLGCRESL